MGRLPKRRISIWLCGFAASKVNIPFAVPHLIFVVVEEGLDEVVVDDLWLPLEQPLLQVERRQVADLVRLVQQRLNDAEEERSPAKEYMTATSSRELRRGKISVPIAALLQ